MENKGKICYIRNIDFKKRKNYKNEEIFDNLSHIPADGAGNV